MSINTVTIAISLKKAQPIILDYAKILPANKQILKEELSHLDPLTFKSIFIKKFEKAFGSFEEAYQYAKTTAIRALNSDNPYEHMIVINSKGQVLKEIIGDKKEVRITKYLKLFDLAEDTFLIHGHPSSTPISIQDFNVLNFIASKEIIAFNKKGEHSLLRKTNHYVQLTKEQLLDYNFKYLKEVLGITKTKLKNKRKSTLDIEKILSLQHTPKGIKRIHEFWKKYAKELNLEYETNYSDCMRFD
jgi:hypothetical protein